MGEVNKEEFKEMVDSGYIQFESDKKCQFCRKGNQDIPITDGETQQEVWICFNCDSSLKWED